MANIAFPQVSLASITCDLTFPGQRINESVYTGSVQAISRGIGRWSGVFAFAQMGRPDQESDILAVDAFFANLDGVVNTFDLPFEAVAAAQRDAFPDGTDLRLMAIERTGSTMRATMNQQSGLAVGYRVTINNYMFVLTSSLVRGECFLSPHRPLAIPDDGLAVNWQAPTLRARLTQSSAVTATRTLETVGPWSAAYQDAL